MHFSTNGINQISAVVSDSLYVWTSCTAERKHSNFERVVLFFLSLMLLLLLDYSGLKKN